MTPYFSVIVPIYQVEEYLRPCVDSILAQTLGDFEVILVDDGSPDGCGAICDEYAARDARVRVIHQENSGLTRARQAGLDQARADYICFVDSDDWVKPGWLEAMRACIEENGRPDVVLFDLVRDDGSPGQPLFAAPGAYDKERLDREIYPYMIWDRRKPFLAQLVPGYMCTKIFRRELVSACYIDRTASIPLFEDIAMAYECLYHAASIFICPEVFYVYRMRDSSILGRYEPRELQKLKTLRDYLGGHLVRQAPETAPQVDAFIMSKIMHAIYAQQEHGFGLREATRHIAAGLEETGLARALDTGGIPPQFRLLAFLLRHRAYGPAVFVYRARLWLYAHRPTVLLRTKPATGDRS